MTKILAISGSLRKRSFNTNLLHAAAQQAPEGIDIEFFEALGELPHFNQDNERDAGAEVAAMRERVQAADALLISSPEYNGAIPGALKNLVDWASRPAKEGVLQNKLVAVIGAAPTPYGGVWAQDQLRKSLGIAGARVAKIELSVADAHQKFDESGALVDEETIAALESAISELVDQHQALAA